jgi:hypothetical protein
MRDILVGETTAVKFVQPFVGGMGAEARLHGMGGVLADENVLRLWWGGVLDVSSFWQTSRYGWLRSSDERNLRE